jgi:hypothetical protein
VSLAIPVVTRSSREPAITLTVASTPARLDARVAAVAPAQPLQFVQERDQNVLSIGIVIGQVHKHADPAHSFALLRPGRKRPCCRTAKDRDELAPVSHSITSSARSTSPAGTIMASAPSDVGMFIGLPAIPNVACRRKIQA